MPAFTPTSPYRYGPHPEQSFGTVPGIIVALVCGHLRTSPVDHSYWYRVYSNRSSQYQVELSVSTPFCSSQDIIVKSWGSVNKCTESFSVLLLLLLFRPLLPNFWIFERVDSAAFIVTSYCSRLPDNPSASDHSLHRVLIVWTPRHLVHSLIHYLHKAPPHHYDEIQHFCHCQCWRLSSCSWAGSSSQSDSVPQKKEGSREEITWMQRLKLGYVRDPELCVHIRSCCNVYGRVFIFSLFPLSAS